MQRARADQSQINRHVAGSLVGANWRETAILALLGSTLIFTMTQPAFRSFFFAENFIYLGQYKAHGDFWQAILSPSDNIFFRPVFFLASLPWYFALPQDPWIYHLRNFAFSVVNLLLLHRVLLRLVTSRWPRLVAFLLFASSKIHLTTIGYINIYDSIVMLMLLLLAILFWLRFSSERRERDYWPALLFSLLSIFSKDYGLAVIAVVAGVVALPRASMSEWRAELGRWIWRLSPLPVMLFGYVAVRYAVVGPLPTTNAVYSPQLSLEAAAQKVLMATLTIGNLSIREGGTLGASGVGGLLAPLPRVGVVSNWIDAIEGIVLAALFIITLVLGRRNGREQLLPLIWIVAYFAPSLLIRNTQIYYYYEVLAGVAVLLGVALGRAGQRMLTVWSIALLVIVANGAISNYTSAYNWQIAAAGAEKIHHDVLIPHRGEHFQTITFITDAHPFWQWTLTADFKGPMLPEITNRHTLQVRFMSHEDVLANPPVPSAADLVYDIDLGAHVTSVLAAPETLWGPLRLRRLTPTGTPRGQGFLVQQNGQSALSVDADNALPGTIIVFDGKPLETTWGGVQWLTALVPAELYSQPGRHEVYLKHATSESNRLEFTVEP